MKVTVDLSAEIVSILKLLRKYGLHGGTEAAVAERLIARGCERAIIDELPRKMDDARLRLGLASRGRKR
jgi:hypothetical protein